MARLRLDARQASSLDLALFLARDAALPLLPTGARATYRALRRLKRRLLRQPADNYGANYWLSPEMRALAAARRQAERHRADALASAHLGKRDRLASLFSPMLANGTEKAVRFTAAFGLQSRLPLRSRAMVEFAFATPELLRLRGRTTKFAHREALRGTLPEDVRRRATKSDFGGHRRRLPEADERHRPRPALDRRRGLGTLAAGSVRTLGFGLAALVALEYRSDERHGAVRNGVKQTAEGLAMKIEPDRDEHSAPPRDAAGAGAPDQPKAV